MKHIPITQTLLKLRLWCHPISWTNAMAFALCLIGSGALLWGVPYLKHQHIASQIKLQQTKIALNQAPKAAASQPTQSEQRLHHFYSALGEVHYAEQQVATLFALATKNGLTLNQADYKLAQNNNGHFHTYTVTFPVEGQYSIIRRFCDQVLRSIPFAALDELSFKRTSISNPIIETRLRLTFYLNSVRDVGNSVSTPSLKPGE